MAIKTRVVNTWQPMPGADARETVLGHLRYEIQRMGAEIAASALSEIQREPLLLHVERLAEELGRMEREDTLDGWFQARRDWTGPRLMAELLRRRSFPAE